MGGVRVGGARHQMLGIGRLLWLLLRGLLLRRRLLRRLQRRRLQRRRLSGRLSSRLLLAVRSLHRQVIHSKASSAAGGCGTRASTSAYALAAATV